MKVQKMHYRGRNSLTLPTHYLLLTILIFALSLVTKSSFAQERHITGTVTSLDGEPLSGATIAVKGTRTSVKTNISGAFIISVPPKSNILIASFVGHQTKEVTLSGNGIINFVLRSLTFDLDSVVVVGYGTQKRRDVTGAISSVSGETIKNLPVQSVPDALQGRIAGVEVIKSSGEPGTSSQIIIRGVSSLNQANPLYIIDGVQQSGDNISPQDIASIDVLKDASAAAIYGAAAAGGVIIITTKRGLPGAKPVVNFSVRNGITTPRVLHLLDKNDFIQFKLLTDDQYYSNLPQAQIDSLPNVDWVKQLYRNGTEENYNLSISGSTPTINYFASGVYNKQRGVFLDNASALAGARINTDFKISNGIKIGEEVNVWKRSTTPVKTAIVSTPFRTVPTGSPYTGNPNAPWGGFPDYQAPNLIAQIKTVKFDFPENNFQGNVYAEVKLPPKYLVFKATFGYTYQTYENNIFRDVYNTAVTPVTINSLYRKIGKFEQLLNAYVLSFDHTYGDHTINLLAGYEQYSNSSSYLQTNATGVSGSSFGYILTSGSVLNLSGGYDPNGLVKSTFGRINYDFKKKYFITATVRRDGNFTVFGPDNRYGVFPAASVGWRIDKEEFFSKLSPYFSLLKLRGSYGELGNSNINPYQYLTTFNLISYQNFANGAPPEAAYTQESLVNQGIKWESVHETNIGVDGEALNGKATFSIDWYNKKTVGLLYGVPLPPSFGLYNGIYVANVGSVLNQGIDIALGYKDHIKDLNWSVNVTGSFNKNKVLNLDNLNNAPILRGNNDYPSAGNGKWTGQPLTYTAAGLPFGQFYGYKVLGIYKTDAEAAAGVQQPNRTSLAGDLIFQDVNHDGQITDLDRTVIGNPYPKLTYGAVINLNWKRIDLSLLFNGVAGVDIFNGVAPYAMSIYDGGNVTSQVFKASFLGSNGLTSQPRIGVADPSGGYTVDPNHNYSFANSYFVENGSYLKLKNIQIGYNFSNNLLSRAKITNARLFVMANNIFTITKYTGIDPELGSQDLTIDNGTTTRGIDGLGRYPNVRIYSVGLDVTF
jgi:TonB-linked SusC/RagA family outer membrane protein